MWNSRRSDRVNHGSCLGTETCKRRLGDVGCRCGAKVIKALQALHSGWEEEKSTASYGKSRLPRKALSFMVLDISHQGSRCCPHKCKPNPVEIGQFLAAYRHKTSPKQEATQTFSDVLAPSIPSSPSALCPRFPSPCSVVPAAASTLSAVCVPARVTFPGTMAAIDSVQARPAMTQSHRRNGPIAKAKRVLPGTAGSGGGWPGKKALAMSLPFMALSGLCVTRVAPWLDMLLSPFSPTARCQNLSARN